MKRGKMIRFLSGDILSADAEALVNTVNCVGIMGRGIALQFKNAFPGNYELYREACDRGELVPGRMFVVPTNQITNPKWIVNFPTKRHWRGNSKIGDIVAGLEDLRKFIVLNDVKSIAIPPLGSGLGGLNWADVRPMIESYMASLTGVDVQVFEPYANSNTRPAYKAAKPPSMTPGRAALVSLVHRYLGGLLDPAISLLEVHKLMYFMQMSGENLRLTYVKGHFGPYAENLTHVLRAIEGYYLTGYMDGGDNPEKSLELVPGAHHEAAEYLKGTAEETHTRFRRVSKLVDGFEAPFGMELLATVHWVATEESANTTPLAVDAVHSWSERKRKFSERQISIAFDRLQGQGWV